jgi:hypothetical protein
MSASFDALKRFIETAPASRLATRPLGQPAEVAILLDGDPPARFTMESGSPQLLPEPARDPDFTLSLPEKAVQQLTTLGSEDVGEYGVAFFGLLLSSDHDLKVRAHINAATSRLLGRGYLSVLASGGAKVAWWLMKNGVRNPKAAIDRLRGR